MTFADQLRPLVQNAGGSAKAAALLRVTPQVVNRWLRGLEPIWAMQVGVLSILNAVHVEYETAVDERVRLESGERLPDLPPVLNEIRLPRLERPPCFGGMLKAPKKV